MRRSHLIYVAAAVSLSLACNDASMNDEPSNMPVVTSAAAVDFRPGPIILGIDPEDTLSSVATGDFNGDGAADLALGAAFADGPENSRADSGEVYIFLGPVGSLPDMTAAVANAAIYGASGGDQAGRALAAGDTNGDGIDDVVIGAPMADGPGDGREDAGRIYVLTGSPGFGSAATDLAASDEAIVFSGMDAGDFMGFAIESADVNGDGIEDVLTGAFWADGPDNQRLDAGEVYVFRGSPDLVGYDLATQPPSMTVYGHDEGDRLGESITSGDIDGDGIAELIAVATFADGPDNERSDCGETLVLDADDDGDVVSTIVGADPGDQLGHSAAARDFNGDGYDDLLLGAVSADGPGNELDLAGEAVVVLGRASLPDDFDVADGDVPIIHGGAAGDRLGRSVAAGDLNGDSLADIVPAAPEAAGAGGEDRVGAIYPLVSSGTLELPESADQVSLVIYGDSAEGNAGSHVFGKPALAVADLNADGLGDLLIGAPLASSGDVHRRGEVRILIAEE